MIAFEEGADYAERANRETFLVVQIETPEAVENSEAIAAVEGIDFIAFMEKLEE